jgi:RHS repeat-associated protein
VEEFYSITWRSIEAAAGQLRCLVLLWVGGWCGLVGMSSAEAGPAQLSGVRYVCDADGRRVLEVRTFTDPDTGVEFTQEGRILIDPLHPSGFSQVMATTGGGGGVESHLVGVHPVAQATWNGLEEVELDWLVVDGRSSIRGKLIAAGTPEPDLDFSELSDFDAFGMRLDGSFAGSEAGELEGESWGERGFRGEWLAVGLGTLDLRARWYEPEIGRFRTADAFEGGNEDPGSQHRYLYAAGDPINRADPSGYFTLLEIDLVQKVQSSIRTVEAHTPRAALESARAKVWDVYWGIRLQASKSAPIHSALFVQNLTARTGIRYEVGILGPKPLLGTSVGGIRRRSASLQAFQRQSTWHFKVARLNSLQYLGWDRAIGFLEADDSIVPIDYSVFGFAIMGAGPSNCTAWSLEAALAAWAASKVGN